MRAFPAGMIWQVEVVQRDRWTHGPLELAFFPARAEGLSGLTLDGVVMTWNLSSPAGFLRPGDAMDELSKLVPSLPKRNNPNLIFVPKREDGLTALHAMLGSLLPDEELRNAGLERRRASMVLSLAGLYDLPAGYGDSASGAFSRYIWQRIAPRARFHPSFFSPKSPLRLLAADTRFWMHRIYRTALDRREEFPEGPSEPDWKPLEELTAEVRECLPAEDVDKFAVRRPLLGGDVWDIDDADERDAMIEEAITGAGVMESLEPVIELLHTQRSHEDFSSRHSWIKEDFERQFYSKRAKLTVELIETVDDAVSWSVDDNEGYGQILFRDVLAWLDRKERRLLLALRMGKTTTEIAADDGLSGHASISRRIQRLKSKVAQLLADG